MCWPSMACMDQDTSEHALMLCHWAGDCKNGAFSWAVMPQGDMAGEQGCENEILDISGYNALDLAVKALVGECSYC